MVLRVTPGPQVDWFPESSLHSFYEDTYRVGEQSNRMGLRLEGTPVAQRQTDEMITEGVSLGAVQVPAGGSPIILFVDQQTTGGYPKIANVISADLHRVGQLRPRDEIRFEHVTFETARSLLIEQEQLLASGESIFGMKRIDLNCDMGEIPEAIFDGTQESLMPYLTSASIACGGHAGDARTMKATIEQALRWKLAVGAHPGYPDRANFGRMELNLPPRSNSRFSIRASAISRRNCRRLRRQRDVRQATRCTLQSGCDESRLGPSDCRWGRSLESGRHTRGLGRIADAGCLSRDWLPCCRGGVC